MPIRFFVPLPGPFVWVRRTPAERPPRPPMGDGERFGRFLIVLLFAYLLLQVAWGAGAGWGLFTTLLVTAGLVGVTVIKWRQGLWPWQD